MRSNITFSILMAGMAMLPMLAAGADGCLHKADDGSGLVLENSVRAVEGPESARSPGSVKLVCNQDSVARINVILPAGTRRGLVLVAGSRDGQFLESRLAGADGWASLAVEESSDGSASRLSVQILAPEEGEEGEVLAGSLLLFDASSREDEPLVTIPLNLTIGGEEPLFRDQFDVDPVIGQFSLVR